MTNVIKIIMAIVLVIVAWKIFKGLVSILITVAAVGLLIWGGMKLLEGPKR